MITLEDVYTSTSDRAVLFSLERIIAKCGPIHDTDQAILEIMLLIKSECMWAASDYPRLVPDTPV